MLDLRFVLFFFFFRGFDFHWLAGLINSDTNDKVQILWNDNGDVEEQEGDSPVQGEIVIKKYCED